MKKKKVCNLNKNEKVENNGIDKIIVHIGIDSPIMVVNKEYYQNNKISLSGNLNTRKYMMNYLIVIIRRKQAWLVSRIINLIEVSTNSRIQENKIRESNKYIL